MPEQPPESVLGQPGRLTSEDIAKMNKALEATQGNRQAAAEILGCTLSRLSAAINNIPALNARWKSEKDVCMGRVDMDDAKAAALRAPPRDLALSTEQRVAVALSVTERKLNKSLAKLGFKTKEIEAISSVEEFAGEHFQATLSIMHGGLLKSAMRLMLLAERIEQTYLQDDMLDEKERSYWWGTYFRILEKLRDFNEQTNKAALTRALIELKKKEAESGKSGGKPSFQPLSAIQVNVTGATEVKVSTPDAERPEYSEPGS